MGQMDLTRRSLAALGGRSFSSDKGTAQVMGLQPLKPGGSSTRAKYVLVAPDDGIWAE